VGTPLRLLAAGRPAGRRDSLARRLPSCGGRGRSAHRRPCIRGWRGHTAAWRLQPSPGRVLRSRRQLPERVARQPGRATEGPAATRGGTIVAFAATASRH
jgi:hypothetical protein